MPAAVTPTECVALVATGAALVDLRDSSAFAEAHPPGAINVRFDDRHLAERVTRLVGSEPRLLLLATDSAELSLAATQLSAAAVAVVGQLDGEIADWERIGAPWVALSTIETADLEDDAARGRYHVLDVREPMEWATGHVPGAQLIALGDVSDRLADVPTDRDVAVICEAGVRSSAAASLLQAAGFARVFNVIDGSSGWRAAGRPVQITEEAPTMATTREAHGS